MSNFENQQSFEATKNQIESEFERIKITKDTPNSLPRYIDKYNKTSNFEKLSKTIYFNLLPEELKNKKSFLIENEFSDEIVDVEVSEDVEVEEELSEDEVSLEEGSESEFEDDNVEEFFN